MKKSHLILLFFLLSCQPTLQEKLNHQWQLFQRAHQNFREHYLHSDQLITRKEWDALIMPRGRYRWESSDLEQLRKEQAVRVRQSFLKAKENSLFDLDLIREKPKKVQEFCAALPKGAMLHIHPFGSFEKQTLQRLLKKYNPKVDTGEWLENLSNSQGEAYLYPAEVQFLKTIPSGVSFLKLKKEMRQRLLDLMTLPQGAHEFERFDAIFWMLGLAVSDREKYFEALLDFGKKASLQKVIYLEFTCSVKPDKEAFLEKLVQTYQKRFGITLRFNHSFYRGAEPKDMRKRAKTLLDQVKTPYLVGIDLLGNEKFTPALERGQVGYGLVSTSLKKKLKMTMHAGELGDRRNPRDALIMGVDRIGHGVALFEDPVALEYARLRNVGVEINISSNLQLKAVKSVKQHPFLNFLRLGLPVSLSTDDEGIFQTDINQECQKVIRETNITYNELKQMSYNSVETSFANKTIKGRLISRLTGQFEIFEQKMHSRF